MMLLSRHWIEPRPDLVVSLIPHFNRTIFEGLRMADARRDGRATPMVTIMTDLADCPPHFWIEPQDQFLICGTAVAERQALAIGLDSRYVMRTSGMIVRPEFYDRLQLCRADELQSDVFRTSCFEKLSAESIKSGDLHAAEGRC